MWRAQLGVESLEDEGKEFADQAPKIQMCVWERDEGHLKSPTLEDVAAQPWPGRFLDSRIRVVVLILGAVVLPCAHHNSFLAAPTPSLQHSRV